MSAVRCRLLAMVATHFLREGYPYEQVCSIVWFRNDELGCDPAAVQALCRQALIEHTEAARRMAGEHA